MAQKELELLCIGNALVDIFTSGDEQTLIRDGIIQPVQHVEIEKIKGLLSELKDQHTVLSSGGGSANVAKIAGFLGAKACFTGAICEADEYGRLFEKDLSTAGVKLNLSLKSSPTGVCLYIKAGEKTYIAASPSAALELSESDISEDELQKAAIVVIDGFILNRAGLVRRILSLAAQHGTVAALDLSSVSIAIERAAEIADFIRQYPLILFMNEQEAAAYCEAPAINRGMTNNAPPFREICTYFEALTAGKPFPIIVIKLGERGAIVFAGGSSYRAETSAVLPLETTGAGDAFCAAFLTAWVRNRPIPECAALGNRAGRIVLDVTGTRVEGEAFTNLARSIN